MVNKDDDWEWRGNDAMLYIWNKSRIGEQDQRKCNSHSTDTTLERLLFT